VGSVVRCVNRYTMLWIEVSVSAGGRQGCTVICGDCKSITCITRSVKRVERTCEEISVCVTRGECRRVTLCLGGMAK